MPRALVIVLDSVGIGGAADAAAYGDAGADTLGHIAEACAAGRGDRAGLRAGPWQLPHLGGARPRPRLRELDRPHAAPGSALDGPLDGRLGLRRRDLPGQGHALRPLGDRGGARRRSTGATSPIRTRPFRRR